MSPNASTTYDETLSEPDVVVEVAPGLLRRDGECRLKSEASAGSLELTRILSLSSGITFMSDGGAVSMIVPSSKSWKYVTSFGALHDWIPNTAKAIIINEKRLLGCMKLI